MRRLLKLAPAVFGVLVLGGIVFGLHHALARIGPRDVLDALTATPSLQIARAVGLLAGSVCIMMVYDVPGVLFARRLQAVPALRWRGVALASFCAYALSHILGAPALTGAAIRLRLYAEWRVPPAGVARILALSGTMFGLGAICLAALLLLLLPDQMALFSNGATPAGPRLIGGGLLAAVCLYVFMAQRRASLVLFGREIPLPGRWLAAAQVVISVADIVLAGAILFTVLPAAPGLTLFAALAIYLVALAGGLFSGLPGGVGVFDTVLLLGLSPYLPAASSIGAILLFRVLYYLVPASAAGLCFAAHEIVATTKSDGR